MDRKRHEGAKGRAHFILFVLGILGFVVVIQFFSQHEISFRNGQVLETTWRYRSSMAQSDDTVMVSTYDKITGTTKSQVFSLTEDALVRTEIVNERRNQVTVIGEDGKILREGPLMETEENPIS